MENMGQEGTGIAREFMLKQIENEIHAGFAFVDAVRRVLKVSYKVEAESQQAQAVEPASSAISQVRIVTHKLGELREAVDLMLEMHLEAQ